jgi:hypothetical protein
MINKKVKVVDNITARDYTHEANVGRLNSVGEIGTVVNYHNSHGLCYDVIFSSGGIATFDPDELIVIDV